LDKSRDGGVKPIKWTLAGEIK